MFVFFGPCRAGLEGPLRKARFSLECAAEDPLPHFLWPAAFLLVQGPGSHFKGFLRSSAHAGNDRQRGQTGHWGGRMPLQRTMGVCVTIMQAKPLLAMVRRFARNRCRETHWDIISENKPRRSRAIKPSWPSFALKKTLSLRDPTKPCRLGHEYLRFFLGPTFLFPL